MVVTKKTPEYTTLDPDFKPLPKYGHLSELDPEFAKAKDAVEQNLAQIWDPSHSLEDFRKAWQIEQAPPDGCPQEGVDVVTETRRIPMRDGEEIEIKVYSAKDKKPGSTLAIRLHGGGWVVGGHWIENAENLLVAGKTNSVVVSVAYRMAPEYKFPTAPNDALDALKWSKENASSLGVDPEKIILIGGSAGSNLAAVAAIMARDEGITGLVGQVLAFPVTCHPKFHPTSRYELGSYRQNHDAAIVNAVRMEWFLDQYMPEPTPDWRFSCLLAPSLRGLPPALLLVAGCDPLRDEGLAYAERLQSEGVPAEVHTYAGMPHCFYGFKDHPKAIDYFGRIVEYVGRLSN